MSNYCVMCGAEIPEGGHVCLNCRRATEKADTPNFKYWPKVCEIQKRQTDKGIKTYGQILEDNHFMTPRQRLEAIEEELIDALMYIEHFKEIIPEEVIKHD